MNSSRFLKNVQRKPESTKDRSREIRKRMHLPNWKNLE